MPSNLKHKIFKRDLPKIEAMAAEGRSRKGIAAELGMVKADFDKAVKSNPIALRRLERGEAQHEWHLYRQLVDIGEKTPNALGRLAFALKARHGYIDNPRPEPPSVTTNVVVTVPRALTEAEYRQRLEAVVEPPQLTDGDPAHE